MILPTNTLAELAPVTLHGKTVRLEPLIIGHVPALWKAGSDPKLWRWIPAQVKTIEDMRAYVMSALEDQQRGAALPFVIMDQGTDQVIGSTRYAAIVPAHRRLEIGWTWLTPAHQRTMANTEAKFLLLTHAFEVLRAIRVEFKTDVLNEKSRNALLRIGAVQEGTFRKHFICDSGRVRDTIYFSILDTEWPPVKQKLSNFLQLGASENR
jgi:RimJ/RimL family protein N-acetyltransferase